MQVNFRTQFRFVVHSITAILLLNVTTLPGVSQTEAGVRIGYVNLIQVKAQTRVNADFNWENAAKTIAEKYGFDIIADTQSIYFGGQLIIDNGVNLTSTLQSYVAGSGSNGPDKAARALPARISYFDLAAIKKIEPAFEEQESMRRQAHMQLVTEVEQGNYQLKEMTARGKPKSEVAAFASRMQSDINAKQKALIELVQSTASSNIKKVATTVAILARQNQIDIVLDRNGVIFGASTLLAAGPDLTQYIAADMQPALAAAAANAGATASGANQSEPVAQMSVTNNTAKNAVIRDKWAVIIGISNFADPRYNLHYSAKDAEDFRDYLIREGKFSTDHVLALTDAQATRANIMRAFGSKWLPNLVEPGDLVVIYISTHGTPASADSGGRNYIVAYDTDVNDLYATAVDMDELARRIKEIRSDRAVIVLDTCYSGGGIPGSRGLDRHDSFDAKKIEVGRGQMVICASSPSERSWESKNCQNGVFTRHLIDALKAGANVDLRTAFEATARQTQWEVKRDHGFSQTPQLGGSWEGTPLILSLPASEPRQMTTDKYADFGASTRTQPAKGLVPAKQPVKH